mmetsp:Transcript_93903/g.265246  ORF Transcript_93903/g.265246 Transcript_93903/m.265246 type:complete len:232 (-) Transcript_93903:2-697(-)
MPPTTTTPSGPRWCKRLTRSPAIKPGFVSRPANKSGLSITVVSGTVGQMTNMSLKDSGWSARAGSGNFMGTISRFCSGPEMRSCSSRRYRVAKIMAFSVLCDAVGPTASTWQIFSWRMHEQIAPANRPTLISAAETNGFSAVPRVVAAELHDLLPTNDIGPRSSGKPGCTIRVRLRSPPRANVVRCVAAMMPGVWRHDAVATRRVAATTTLVNIAGLGALLEDLSADVANA